MKKLAVLSLGVALMVGCTTQQIGWEQGNQIEIAEHSGEEINSPLGTLRYTWLIFVVATTKITPL